MFKNYLLLSLKVLKRKPFYTFISLFGISFTLMILMLLTSLFDSMLGSNAPLSNGDRMILIPTLERVRIEQDTLFEIDSTLVAGTMRYDTAMTFQDNQVANSNNPMSYRFVSENLVGLESAQHVAMMHNNSHVDGYLDGRKFSFSPYYVNAAYYDVFDFTFLYGDRFLEDDIESATKSVIITTKAANDYFGYVGQDLLGKEMELSGQFYRVRGVVERPLSDNPMVGGDLYLPVTLLDPRELSETGPGGGFWVAMLARTEAGTQAIQDELNGVAENFRLPPESYFTKINLMHAKPRDAYAQSLLGVRDPDRARRMLMVPITILILLFVALPLLNLVNLNTGRVAERRAEIGVRKAFGATGGTILWQFIFENLVLTVIGGAIGLALGLAMISYVNANDLLGITRLSASPIVFVYFLLVVLFFGFVSGILPAYRMSQTNVANSLR